MEHPKMFDDGDPLLHRVSALALAFPGAEMKVSHGRPAFFTKKIFAYYGGSIKGANEWIQHPQSVLVIPDPGDRQALVEDSRVYLPGYLGPYGWIGIDLDQRTDWAEIAELLDASYRLTAPKRNIAELDATSG
jgi:predicted DNA-binding protein (MmcQ/YjbR family)